MDLLTHFVEKSNMFCRPLRYQTCCRTWMCSGDTWSCYVVDLLEQHLKIKSIDRNMHAKKLEASIKGMISLCINDFNFYLFLFWILNLLLLLKRYSLLWCPFLSNTAKWLLLLEGTLGFGLQWVHYLCIYCYIGGLGFIFIFY